MAETIIKINLNESPYTNDKVHNRWHPDIPMVAKVKPGDDFKVECYDWTGGQIKNNDHQQMKYNEDIYLNQIIYIYIHTVHICRDSEPNGTAQTLPI